MAKRILFGTLCTLLGAVFIFSGYTKLYPIEPFEYTFVDIGLVNWHIAPFVSRILISLEFLIGTLLILNLQLRTTAYKAGIALLIIFSIYLILLMIFSGNKGNCGCFGTYFEMTPLQALIKNGIMLVIFFILFKFHTGWELNKKLNYLIAIPFALAFVMPFVLNPVELDYSRSYLDKQSGEFKMELDTLYNNAKLNKPPQELSTGKHVIAFLSLTCKHCKVAANKIRIMHERDPSIPFYFVLNGDEADLQRFFRDTGTQDIPHCILLGRHFVYLAGTILPDIFMIDNGMIVNDVNYMDLDQDGLEKWLNK